MFFLRRVRLGSEWCSRMTLTPRRAFSDAFSSPGASSSVSVTILVVGLSNCLNLDRCAGRFAHLFPPQRESEVVFQSWPELKHNFRIIQKFKIDRIKNRCVGSNGVVIGNDIGVISALLDRKSGIDRSPEHRCTKLTSAAADIEDGFIT